MLGITRAWYYLLRKRDPIVVEGLVQEAAAWGRMTAVQRRDEFKRILERYGLWTKQGTARKRRKAC
jgi:hypothetical protein